MNSPRSVNPAEQTNHKNLSKQEHTSALPNLVTWFEARPNSMGTNRNSKPNRMMEAVVNIGYR